MRHQITITELIKILDRATNSIIEKVGIKSGSKSHDELYNALENTAIEWLGVDLDYPEQEETQ